MNHNRDEFIDYGLLDEEIDIISHPNSFQMLLKWHLRNPEKVSYEELSRRTGMSLSVISRMVNAEQRDYNPDLKYIMAFILGLHINYFYAEKILNQAGFNLSLNTRRNRLYKKLLLYYYNLSVKDCNDYLVQNGEDPLTKNENITSYHVIKL